MPMSKTQNILLLNISLILYLLISNTARINASTSTPPSKPSGKLAYVSGSRTDTQSENGENLTQFHSIIWLHDFATETRKIFYEIDEPIGALDWSPDGKYMLFVSQPEDYRTQIYVIDATGNVTYRGEVANDDDPVWSPDSQYIAYIAYRQRSLEIMIMKFDGTQQRQLTNDAYEDYEPAWSPDGTQLAYWSRRDNDAGEIYIFSALGLNRRRLTQNTSWDASPIWSKDGKSIYYISSDSVYIMDVTGANQRSIAEFDINDWFWHSPAVPSPDETKLVFTPKGKGIYTVNTDGSNLQNIVNRPSALDPKWSSDGRYIAFNDTVNGYSVIKIISVNGHTEQQISVDNDTFNYSPAWLP